MHKDASRSFYNGNKHNINCVKKNPDEILTPKKWLTEELGEEPDITVADYNKPSPFTLQVGGNHYKDMAIQPTEYCQKNELNFCEANIVKYASRHKLKNGREDVEKIIHYAQLILEMEYNV